MKLKNMEFKDKKVLITGGSAGIDQRINRKRG